MMIFKNLCIASLFFAFSCNQQPQLGGSQAVDDAVEIDPGALSYENKDGNQETSFGLAMPAVALDEISDIDDIAEPSLAEPLLYTGASAKVRMFCPKGHRKDFKSTLIGKLGKTNAQKARKKKKLYIEKGITPPSQKISKSLNLESDDSIDLSIEKISKDHFRQVWKKPSIEVRLKELSIIRLDGVSHDPVQNMEEEVIEFAYSCVGQDARVQLINLEPTKHYSLSILIRNSKQETIFQGKTNLQGTSDKVKVAMQKVSGIVDVEFSYNEDRYAPNNYIVAPDVLENQTTTVTPSREPEPPVEAVDVSNEGDINKKLAQQIELYSSICAKEVIPGCIAGFNLICKATSNGKVIAQAQEDGCTARQDINKQICANAAYKTDIIKISCSINPSASTVE